MPGLSCRPATADPTATLSSPAQTPSRHEQYRGLDHLSNISKASLVRYKSKRFLGENFTSARDREDRTGDSPRGAVDLKAADGSVVPSGSTLSPNAAVRVRDMSPIPRGSS
jgi:hypothetical protein